MQVDPTLYDIDTKIEGTCGICISEISTENMVIYEMAVDKPWYFSKFICSSCLVDFINYQNDQLKTFQSHITDLSQCSKALKSLINGQSGVPVNIRDYAIFPYTDNNLNIIDGQYGRSNEVYRLQIGSNKDEVDAHLSNAPKNRGELRILLYNLLIELEHKLEDYSEDDQESILESIQSLKLSLLNQVYFKQIHPEAKIPSRQTIGSAGYDLSSVDKLSLEPGERKLVSTGLAMALPCDYYGRIAPRSGLAVKFGLDILAGILDSDYRGEIKVVLINLGGSVVEINEGDRIAQLIIEKCYHLPMNTVIDLPNTGTRLGGFGSTGTS